MPAPRIPDRNPIGDAFEGMVIKANDHFLLSDASINGYDTVHQGTFTIRYGVTFLGKPHLSIVPALMALDYGAFLTGDEMWEFLLNKSNLYPRADVLGHRNDGTDAQMFVKELDLMYPFDILVYSDDSATTPLCKVDAFISTNETTIPTRLEEYANIFPTINDWSEAIT